MYALAAILLMCCTAVSAQDTVYTLTGSIEIHPVQFSADNLGNTYILNDKNELSKYDPSGALLYAYHSKVRGKPASIDVSDPLKVLLYYPHFYQGVLLDNTLSEISRFRIDPSVLNGYISLITSAKDNTFWAYEESGRKLLKLDQSMKVLIEGPDIYQAYGKNVKPDFIIGHEGFIYLNDPLTGILQFDLYGGYTKTIPLKGLERFQFLDDELIYFKEGTLRAFHMLTLKERIITLPLLAEDAWLSGRTMFLLAKNQLFLYTF